MTDTQVQAIVGADAHVATLADAVATCLAAAAGEDLRVAAAA
jgi:hypothetical protein